MNLDDIPFSEIPAAIEALQTRLQTEEKPVFEGGQVWECGADRIHTMQIDGTGSRCGYYVRPDGRPLDTWAWSLRVSSRHSPWRYLGTFEEVYGDDN